MTYHRYLEPIIKELCFSTGKMAFVSGPRQCGKTTMAKLLLKERGFGEYYNWDEVKFRRQWLKDPHLILPIISGKTKPIIILDELHKAKLWKRNLKGLYDTQENAYDIFVTGSARLNVYRKGSDSLLGRYYHFRLHPFSVGELLKNRYFAHPNDLLSVLFSSPLVHSKKSQKILENLYQLGPFPEPLLTENEKSLRLWQRNRVERIIREDLRDLSRLPELSQIEMLASLLPERAAQPLSLQALSEILEVAYTTVKRWTHYLNELYYIFSLKPYAKSLSRALKKESKLYLWDWSEVENKGARFENLVAAHLLKYCDYLTDSGEGHFELRYLKNKEKFEIDFLLLWNKKIFLPIEVKLTDETPSPSWAKLMGQLNCAYGVQLVMKPGVHRLYEHPKYKILVISAAQFLQYLI
jgi:predicted AAA+ superfamily ATPase